MANQPISISLANEMISSYLGYMRGLNVDMSKQTHSISFTAPELLKWMTEVKPFTDEFRICEGVYPPGHEFAGRITTIIWPYKNGQPATKPTEEGKSGGGSTGINPFNEGHLNP